MSQENDEIVTFRDEEGTERSCVILLVTEFDGGVYAALAPVEQIVDEDADLELYLFEVTEDEEGQTFSYIEDEARYDAVAAFISSMMQDEAEA